MALVNTVLPSQADVAVGGYSGYTSETFAADTIAQNSAHTSLVASASTASIAGDFAEANGSESGSYPQCSVTTYKPRGHFDTQTNTVYVEVTSDVWCNVTSPQITMKVFLQGHEGGRSVNHPSSEVTCSGAHSCTATSYYSRYTYCDENFDFEHYGRPYGSFKLKNGSWQTLVGDGVQGPSARGSTYRFC